MTKKEIGIVLAKLEALHEDIREVKGHQEDTSKRLNAVEKQQSWFKGVFTVTGAIFVGALSWIWRHLLHI